MKAARRREGQTCSAGRPQRRRGSRTACKARSGMRVRDRGSKSGKGRILIDYSDLDDFERDATRPSTHRQRTKLATRNGPRNTLRRFTMMRSARYLLPLALVTSLLSLPASGRPARRLRRAHAGPRRATCSTCTPARRRRTETIIVTGDRITGIAADRADAGAGGRSSEIDLSALDRHAGVDGRAHPPDHGDELRPVL